MRNFKKALASVVLGGVCALSFTMTACSNEEDTTPTGDEHEHTYSTDWVYNSTQHWHAASCDDTNSVSDQASHVDDDNDGVCDVCGFNYAHTHVYSDEWSYDATSHWHDALCGHTTTADSAVHTANAAGVCTVCGYQVNDPDVSTVENALAVAEAQNYLAEHGEGDIIYYNGLYGRTSYYSLSYDIYDDYTYTYYESAYGTEETWNSLTSNGSIFSVVSSDGGTPTLNTIVVPEEALNGYAFENFFFTNEDYYGITALVSGLYSYAAEYDYLDESSVEDGVYSFSMSHYEVGYSTAYDAEAGELVQVRDQYYDYYYIITVEFTLSSQNYIDDVEIVATSYDYDGLKFAEGDTEGQGTLKEDATPYIQYTYTLEQGGRNPYVADEILMTDYNVVDSEGNVVSGDEADVEAITLAPYSSNTFTVTDLVPDTADVTLDSIAVTLEVYDEEADEYVSATSGYYNTLNVYASNGTIRITPYVASGTYRITLTSANITKYINVVVAYPDPTSISATANGTDVDSYTVYAGVGVTIGGSIDSGNPAYTVAITSENAVDATLTGDYSTGYTFSSDTVGTYTLTVTSTADESVSDTIEIVVTEAPEISEILNGNYVYDVSNDYTGYFDTENVYIGFTPDNEGALTGTFSYYIPTWNYGTFSGSTTYSYDSETGAITLGEDVEDMSLSIVSYSPVVTLTGTMYGRAWTITISGFVATDEDVPEEGSDSGEADSILGALTSGISWWNLNSNIRVLFNEDYTGYFTTDDESEIAYFEWSYSDGTLTLYPAVNTGYVDTVLVDFVLNTATDFTITIGSGTDWFGNATIIYSFEFNGETFTYTDYNM